MRVPSSPACSPKQNGHAHLSCMNRSMSALSPLSWLKNTNRLQCMSQAWGVGRRGCWEVCGGADKLRGALRARCSGRSTAATWPAQAVLWPTQALQQCHPPSAAAAWPRGQRCRHQSAPSASGCRPSQSQTPAQQTSEKHSGRGGGGAGSMGRELWGAIWLHP